MLPTHRIVWAYAWFVVSGCAGPESDTQSPAPSDRDGDGSPDDEDCAPDDPSVAPLADETCNGIDDDCDGDIDDADDAIDPASGTTYYEDLDADGFGSSSASVRCDAGTGWVLENSDCDDTNPDVNPDATEVCDNGIDDDCVGGSEDAVEWYADVDGDGWGDPGDHVSACDQPGGYVSNDDDCLDSDSLVNPRADEVCDNGFDDDCDGSPTCNDWGTISLDDADVAILGAASGDLTGNSVAFAGDVDGDGEGDILVGANGAASAHGRVYLFTGPLEDPIDTSDAHATFEGEGYLDDMGGSVAAAGDTNRDGYDDVIMGSALVGTSNSGGAYLVLGPTTGQVDLTDADVRLIGEQGDDFTGNDVAGGGDFDDDGFADIVVVSEQARPYPLTSDGAVYLLAGPLAGNDTLDDADAVYGNMGRAPTSASNRGDVDGDGFDDLVIGNTTRLSTGEFYCGVVFLIFAPVSGIQSIDDAYDVQMIGEHEEAFAGSDVEIAGDTDGDGRDDVLIGSPGSGLAYVVTRPSPGDMDLGDADAKLYGAGTNLGTGVADAGDVNGDGFHDVLVSDSGGKSGDKPSGGAFVFFGPLAGTSTTSAAEATLTPGASDSCLGPVSSAGDANDDGLADLLLGSPCRGAAYVIFARDL